MAETPVEVPHPRRERIPTLSQIDLRVPSLCPPKNDEELADPRLEAVSPGR